MALQEEGWPLGLRPVNARVGLVRNRDFNGSLSFSTLLTSSPPASTTESSSDLDTESTGSFFHDRSVTLGSLIGVPSILELSRRSTRRRRTSSETLRDQKNIYKPKPWLFSLCSKITTDAVNTNHTTASSLGRFLEGERRAAASRNNNNEIFYGPNDFSPLALPNSDLDSLFIGDRVATQPQSSASTGARRSDTEFLQNGNGYGVPLLFSCLCSQLTH